MNRLLKALLGATRVHHHFTTAYCRWSHGPVERICREVFRACRALLSECKLAPHDWPFVTEAVRSISKQYHLRRLGLRDDATTGVFRTPLKVFTGHKQVRPLLHALPIGSFPNSCTSDEGRAGQLRNIRDLQEARHDMHKQVDGRVSESRMREI